MNLTFCRRLPGPIWPYSARQGTRTPSTGASTSSASGRQDLRLVAGPVLGTLMNPLDLRTALFAASAALFENRGLGTSGPQVATSSSAARLSSSAARFCRFCSCSVSFCRRAPVRALPTARSSRALTDCKLRLRARRVEGGPDAMLRPGGNGSYFEVPAFGGSYFEVHIWRFLH